MNDNSHPGHPTDAASRHATTPRPSSPEPIPPPTTPAQARSAVSDPAPDDAGANPQLPRPHAASAPNHPIPNPPDHTVGSSIMTTARLTIIARRLCVSHLPPCAQFRTTPLRIPQSPPGSHKAAGSPLVRPARRSRWLVYLQGWWEWVPPVLPTRRPTGAGIPEPTLTGCRCLHRLLLLVRLLPSALARHCRQHCLPTGCRWRLPGQVVWLLASARWG